MAADSETTREEFDTEAEAIAFTEGLDYADNDHISWEPAFIENDKWVVEVRQFV